MSVKAPLYIHAQMAIAVLTLSGRTNVYVMDLKRMTANVQLKVRLVVLFLSKMYINFV